MTKIGDEQNTVINTKTEEKQIKKQKPKEIIFIIDNGVAKKRIVKSGISDDSYIEIIEGANEGDEVVKGSFKAISKDLEDNMKVKVDNNKKKITKDKEQ